MAEQPERPNEQDDYDLLTYGEAGDRLATEIANEQKRIAELTEAGGVPDGEDPVRKHRDRLAALEEAQRRNRKQPINDENFERFFGYPAAPSS